MHAMHAIEHSFKPGDLVAGNVVLDFINTVTARDQSSPVDWLVDYRSLLDWARLSGRFDQDDLDALDACAHARPTDARKALERARHVRELLHATLEALVEARQVPAPVHAALEREWRRACGKSRFGFEGGRLAVVQSVEASALDVIAQTLTLEAAAVFSALDHHRVRRCPGAHCGWYFVDTSKAGRRRWCDMATCGNAAKAQRHQKKIRLDGATRVDTAGS